MRGPFLLQGTDPDTPFPDIAYAIDEPNGLLAIGGDLEPQRLLNAYRHGIFPWYNEDQPIIWWSPDPRLVLKPDEINISKSLAKFIRKKPFQITIDHAFDQVIAACAGPRPKELGTWLSPDMQKAYLTLHELGYAHSVEAWQNEELVGGLYGIALGKVFFGESMFSRQTNASKVAFVRFVEQLRQWEFQLIDCQVETAHLMSLGAQNIDRASFKQLLDRWCDIDNPQTWKLRLDD